MIWHRLQYGHSTSTAIGVAEREGENKESKGDSAHTLDAFNKSDFLQFFVFVFFFCLHFVSGSHNSYSLCMLCTFNKNEINVRLLMSELRMKN